MKEFALDNMLSRRISGGNPKWRLVAGGDCSFDGCIGRAFREGHPDKIIDGEILGLISGSDMALINLETPLCRKATPIIKTGPNFMSAPEVALGLESANLKYAALANNHIMDQGLTGLQETLISLDRYGILHHGAGSTHEDACRPLQMELRGQKVALLNFTEGEFSRCRGNGPGAARLDPFENNALISQVASGSDIVIVSVHAGNEYQFFPSPWIQNTYRRFIDAGATLVLGHHPHVPQGIEEYKNGIIVYSLGNFLFDYQGNQARKSSRVSFLLGVNFGQKDIVSISVYPFQKDESSKISLFTEESKKKFLNFINLVSSPLTDSARLNALWEQQVMEMFEKYTRHLNRFGRHSFNDIRPDKEISSLFLNLLQCNSSLEVLKTAFTMMYEGRFTENPESKKFIGDLRQELCFERKRASFKQKRWEPWRLFFSKILRKH